MCSRATSKDPRLFGKPNTKQGPYGLPIQWESLCPCCFLKRNFFFFKNWQGHEDTRTPYEFRYIAGDTPLWALPISRRPCRLSLQPRRLAARGGLDGSCQRPATRQPSSAAEPNRPTRQPATSRQQCLVCHASSQPQPAGWAGRINSSSPSCTLSRNDSLLDVHSATRPAESQHTRAS